jgi:hypothetical protein
MKKLIILAILVAAFATVGVVQADEPYVRISTDQKSLNLGTISFWDDGLSSETLTVIVESNCLHGPIVAAISELKRSGCPSITPDRVEVKTPATNGFVSMAQPVAISETTMGSHKIEMSFKIKTYLKDRAGRYSGTLAFTVMPPS